MERAHHDLQNAEPGNSSVAALAARWGFTHLGRFAVEYRRRYGVPESLASCHTAVVSGYAIEGHVPAREIKRLLAERPKALGLAVPGMPVGSPGMEGPKSDPYEVLLFQRDGSFANYARYGR